MFELFSNTLKHHKMVELFVAALLALGIITSSDQATQELIDQHQTEINAIIVEGDLDGM